MFVIFYDFLIGIYGTIVNLASLRNRKAKLFLEGRKNWKKKFQFLSQKNNVIWFHTASLGEYELSVPLIQQFKNEMPDSFVMVTFFSPSGYEHKKDIPEVGFYGYLPLDKKHVMGDLVDLVNPRLVLFAKYELWYHLIGALAAKKIPTVLFSGIFRENQIFFKPFAKKYLSQIQKIDHFFVIDESSKQTLYKYDIKNVTVNGDSRFEKVHQNKIKKFRIPEVEEFLDGDDCLVVGSSWPQDIELIAQLANNRKFPLKLIVAPHDVSENSLSKTEKSFTKEVIRFSKLREGCASCAQVLLIDNVGMLSNLYQYGMLAFVGGAFQQGLHNILEPIVFGLPVFFGPKIEKYPEAITASQQEIGFSVENISTFENIFYDLLNDEQKYSEISEKCKKWVDSNLTVNKQVVDFSVSKFCK